MKHAPLLAISLAAILSGCNKPNEAPGQVRVAVIPKGTTHLYWKSVEAGAMRAGTELGVEVTFIGPQREDDRSQQIDLVKNQTLLNDALVLAPLDAAALRDVAKEAAGQGKPVVIIDSSLADSAGFITSYVATDNTECGRIGARTTAAAVGEKGKIAMLRYMQGSASTEQREQGFLDEIAKFPGIEVVSSEQFAGATASDAQNTATNLVTRLTDGGALTVDAIFCSNQTSTYGMLQALRGKDLAGKVKFIGVDCDATFIDALKKGEMQGIVLQDPHNMGYLGVKTAVAKLKGEKVEPVIDTGATLVNPDNLAEPKIDALVKTQLQ
jgi:ribose transport system substrate-binding protein